MKLLRTCEVKHYLISHKGLPRPVYWFNDQLAEGTWTDRHVHHLWGELAYVATGKMVICTRLGNFLVPPERAAWIPPGLPHEWFVPDAANDRSLYIDPAALPHGAMFSVCRIFDIPRLVRELILALDDVPHDYAEGPDKRLVQTLLDRLPRLTQATFSLRLPADRRLLRLCVSLLNTPDSTRSIREWSEELGMSERNLGRLFQRETGETLGQWRYHARLAHARERLESGESVTSAALECGYTSVSAFIAAFRRRYGQTPGSLLGQIAR